MQQFDDLKTLLVQVVTVLNGLVTKIQALEAQIKDNTVSAADMQAQVDALKPAIDAANAVLTG